jgi:hypothetical protein
MSRPPFGENPDVDVVRIAAATSLRKRDELIAEMIRAIGAAMRGDSHIRRSELISWAARAGIELDDEMRITPVATTQDGES